MHAYSYINEKYRCVQNNIAESTPPEQFQKAIDKFKDLNLIGLILFKPIMYFVLIYRTKYITHIHDQPLLA